MNQEEQLKYDAIEKIIGKIIDFDDDEGEINYRQFTQLYELGILKNEGIEGINQTLSIIKGEMGDYFTEDTIALTWYTISDEFYVECIKINLSNYTDRGEQAFIFRTILSNKNFCGACYNPDDNILYCDIDIV